MNKSLGRFMRGGMLVLSESTSAKEAARAMHERRVGSVVVCNDSGKVVGIVTDRDLSSQVIGLEYSPYTPIAEFMASDVARISEQQTIEDAIQLMELNGVRRIPIVRTLESGSERCVGMVTLDDLMADRLVETDALQRIVSQQIVRPARHVDGHSDKREARQEQTLNRFYNSISNRTGLDRPTTEGMVYFLLSALVQRMPRVEALHLISRLPRLIQEDLLLLASGPRRELSAGELLSEASARFGVEPHKVTETMSVLWTTLDDLSSPEMGSRETIAQRFSMEVQSLFA